MTLDSSSAIVSVAVHKDGAASDWFGHNILLRCTRFLLTPMRSSSAAAFTTAKKQQNDDTTSAAAAVLARCCSAVDSAAFDPRSLELAGSIADKFRPAIGGAGAGDEKTQQQQDAPPVISAEKHSALFRWPVSTMSQFDATQILKSTIGAGGLLSSPDDPKAMPEIFFRRTSHDANSVTGNLTIRNVTNEVTCNAFLSGQARLYSVENKQKTKEFSGGNAAAAAAAAGESGGGNNNPRLGVTAVFQCPVDTARWNVAQASFLGILKTQPTVWVEVAVPADKLLAAAEAK